MDRPAKRSTTPNAFRGDPVACAKKDLAPGDTLDGEGGYTVWGKLIPAARSVAEQALPIGLAQDVTVTRAVKAGQIISQADVALPADDETLAYRRAMEAAHTPAMAAE
ncbi:MAG: SAF domain-containing protein [Pseudomonadota bacterium]